MIKNSIAKDKILIEIKKKELNDIHYSSIKKLHHSYKPPNKQPHLKRD
jgi:hypothetical protein